MTILTPVSASDNAGAVGVLTRVLHKARTGSDTASATDAPSRSGMGRQGAASDAAGATDVAARTNIHQSARVTDSARAADTNTRSGNKWFAAGVDSAPAIDSNGAAGLRFIGQWTADVSQSAARSRGFSATIRVRAAIVPTPPLLTVLR